MKIQLVCDVTVRGNVTIRGCLYRITHLQRNEVTIRGNVTRLRYAVVCSARNSVSYHSLVTLRGNVTSVDPSLRHAVPVSSLP